MLGRPPPPRLDAKVADRLRANLVRRLGDSKVVTDADVLASFGRDESEQDPVCPDAVVRAESSDDIVTAFEVAAALHAPVTPRGAGTGKSGGAVPVCGGVVIATLGMNQLLEIDNKEHLAVVEPGLILGDLYTAVEAEGLFYPPDPNSHRICALGGTIAENAGGPRAFKYGVTRDYVLGLDVVTPSGTRLSTGRRTKKGVTGYDLTALLVGSEGTLALTTRATLRLLRKPEMIVTVLGLFENVADCADAVERMVASGLVPRCLELLDSAALGAMRREGVSVSSQAGALLIVEVDGDEHTCERDLERVGNHCAAAGSIEVLVAQDPQKREDVWKVRRDLSYATRKMAAFKISEDVVVPRQSIGVLIERVAVISEATGIMMLCYGHAGDGNIHVNLLWDDVQQAPAVEMALDQLFRSVVGLRGTLSGEHGIGTSKARFLHYEQDEALIQLQQDIKGVFDPKGILNPYKIFARPGHRAC